MLAESTIHFKTLQLDGTFFFNLIVIVCLRNCQLKTCNYLVPRGPSALGV